MERLEGVLSSRGKEYALVILFFLILAIVFTWPLILHVHNGIVGGHGDPLLNTWIINWDAKTIFTNPTALFQGNIIYPSRDVLAYSEHQFTLGLIAAPVYFIFQNPVLSYNFVLFFSFVVAGFGCYLLIKELTGSRWGGLAGGVFYALCPYIIAQMSHIQILFCPFLPLALLYLYRFLADGGRKNVILFGLFFVAQSLSSWHYLIYTAMACGLLWLWKAVFSRDRKSWMRLAWVAAAIAAAALIILPFALPYLRAHRRLPGFERTQSEVEMYGADGEDYLRVLNVSMVYGDAPSPFEEGGIGFEDVLYSGVVILVLALAGLFIRRSKEDELEVFQPTSLWRGAIFFLILGVLSVLLTFGPKLGGWSNPFYMIPYKMGVLKFTRVPTRFFILVALSLAILGGYGVAKLCLRSVSYGDGRRILGQLTGVALVALVILELLTFNLHVDRIPVYSEVPEVYDWLKDQGDVKIIELPTYPLGGAIIYDRDLELKPVDIFEYLFREGDIMYFSTYHWKQVINGYSGYSPFFYRRIITEMQGFPSQRTVHLLQGLHVDYVIWDWEWTPYARREEYNVRLFSTLGLSLVEDFDSKSVFRVEPGDTARADEMEASMVVPDAIPPGEVLDLGLLLTNHTDRPFVCVDEEPQLFTLRFVDGSGNQVAEVGGDYRAPFFVDAGETISLPMSVEVKPPTGSCQVVLELEGGVIGSRDFNANVELEEMPVSAEPAVMDGEIAAEVEGDTLLVPDPDGLYPLMVVKVINTGDTLWQAEGADSEHMLPPGSVHLGLKWLDEDGTLWEDQGCSLPCDVFPGQEVEVPLLVRPPAVPGTYRLDLGFYREGSGYFGEMATFEVKVEGWFE